MIAGFALLVLGQVTPSATSHSAPLATLKAVGFEAQAASEGKNGWFIDTKTGLGGTWQVSPFESGSDIDLSLVLRYPSPLDVSALAAKFTERERWDTIREGEPHFSLSGIVRLRGGSIGGTNRTSWDKAVLRAQQFISKVGRPLPQSLSQLRAESDAGKLPLQLRVTAVGERDLTTLAQQFAWPRYTGGGGMSGTGALTLWIGKGETLYFWLSIGGVEGDEVLGDTRRTLFLDTPFGRKQDDYTDERLSELRKDFPDWRFERSGTEQLRVTARIDLSKGVLVKEIHALLKKRMDQAARLSNLFQ